VALLDPALAKGRSGLILYVLLCRVLIVGDVVRVPEGASIHDKSYYTSNKDHLFYALLDISLHVQAHTQAELAHSTSMYCGFYDVEFETDICYSLVLGKFKAL
jgi:hypothetical protein